jgi:hypothetical protein
VDTPWGEHRGARRSDFCGVGLVSVMTRPSTVRCGKSRRVATNGASGRFSTLHLYVQTYITMHIQSQRRAFTMAIESAAVAGMAQRKTTQFTMRMDPEVKEAAERGAAEDRRSLSSLIEILLIDYCKKRGLLTEEGRLPKKGRR